MKTSLYPALALIAVAACNSQGSVDTYAQYLESSARARCDRAISCQFLPESDRATCEQFFREVTNTPTLPLTLDSLADGRVAYDKAAARRCVEGLAQMECIGTSNFLLIPVAACSQVLVPRVASGGSCENYGECQSGYQCAGASQCEATCVAAPTEGQTCDRAVCVPGNTCDYSGTPDTPPTCRRQPGQGESCFGRGPTECRDGLVCIIDLNTGTGTCRPPAAQGEPCFGAGNVLYHPTRSSCQSGLACNWLLPTPVCQSPARNGEDCGSPDACQDGLVCIGYGGVVRNPPGTSPPIEVYPGRCSPPPASDAACSSPADCPWQHACTGGRCERLARLGESCIGTPCASGYCAPATSTCQPRQPPGGACDPAGPPDQCSGFPTQCDQATSRCVSSVVVCENGP